MKPFLSIVVPVYKIEETYLRFCLDSIIKQDMNEFRIILVDDGSPDKCGNICDEYADKDERITVIHQDNTGVSGARNAGIEETDTEWITFVDPDDWIEPNHVSTLYTAQNIINDADIFLFDYIQEFDGRKKVKYLKECSGWFGNEWIYNFRIALFNFLKVNGKVYEYEVNTVWNKMYRTRIIKENQLKFDLSARKGQDMIFNAEYVQLADKFYYIHAALYHYRYLQNSITNRFNPKVQYYNEIAFEQFERIIKKYQLPQEYWEAYYAKVITRLYSCMRLYYYNPDNNQSKKVMDKELEVTLERQPYKKAMNEVKYSNLMHSQKIFVYFLKHRNYSILRILVKARQLLKNLKGNKLKL